jgi:acyl-CoA thioesterase-2
MDTPGARVDFGALMALAPAGADTFVAARAPEAAGRLYGGQLLAQGLVACSATADADRAVHSLHAYFLRAGAVDVPVEYRIARVRDGRAFSTREASAWQSGRELFRMLVSFHVPEPGDAYARAALPRVPPPEQVTTTYDAFVRAGMDGEPWHGGVRPMEIRYVDAPRPADREPIVDNQRTWMRIAGALSDEVHLHAAALAYLSDSTLIDHVALVHGRRWQDAGLEGASLDHAMWFRTPVRADAWLLFDQQVECTGSARGLVSGRILAADGTLAATCMQEGLARWT